MAVSELRVKRLENDVSSIYEMLTDIKSVQHDHTLHLERIDRKLVTMDHKLVTMDHKLVTMDRKLDALEQVDRKLDALLERIGE